MKDLKYIISDTKEKIVHFVLNHDKTCGEDFGVHFLTLKLETNVAETVLKDALNELYIERKVNVRDASCGKLIFLNYDNPEILKLQEI